MQHHTETQLLPYSFGFEANDQFVQGTSYIHKSTRQVGVCGTLPSGEEYIDLQDLANKTKWTDDQMKSFIDKLQILFNKQQNGQ